MLRNYLITAWRNIRKSRSFTLINIIGLAFGMAVCMLVLQYVGNQLSYDAFHSKKDRIYRVGYNYINTEGLSRWAITGPGVIQLQHDFPEVENLVRMIDRGEAILSHEDTQGQMVKLKEKGIYYADSTLLDVFDFKLLQGNAEKVLREQHTMLISASAASRWFGDENPIGKTLILDHKEAFLIEGVLQDLPQNSHIQFNYLLSYVSFKNPSDLPLEKNMALGGTYVYLLLERGTDPDQFLVKINTRFDHYSDYLHKLWEWSGSFFLQPLREIHTTDDLWADVAPRQNIKRLYALGLLGLLILLMAWINYINLATVRSVERSKEVGIRKSIGAARKQLIMQFLMEAMVLNVVAFLLALVMVALSQDYFSQFTGWTEASELWQQPSFWITLLLSFLIGSLLSGLYPAFVLTAYQPVKALKGGYQSSIGGKNLRKVLSVMQYAASVSLLIGTLIIYNQISYLQNQELGFNMEQIFVVRVPTLGEKVTEDTHKAFRQQVSAIPAVIDFTYSYLIPGDADANMKNLYRKDDPEKKWAGFDAIGGIDHNFLDFYNIKLINGRFFEPAQPTDSVAFVLSETAIKRLGYASAEEALNEIIMVDNDLHDNYGFQGGPIIGVIEDYQLTAPNRRQMEVYQHGNSGYCLTLGDNIFQDRSPRYYSLKVDMTNWHQTATQIKEAFQKVYPDEVYEYFFQDEFYHRQYQSDLQFFNIFVFFVLQAILIACLGLFGLAAFQVQKRRKEIGIRKTLGASMPDIWLLLAKDLMKALLIASLIGIPVVNYFMKSWLEEFIIKVPLSWWMFALPVVLMTLIALLTVSQHLKKAAKLNPVKLLRYE